MKTATPKALDSHRSSSNIWISLGHILRELAPILIPSILFSICIYCCIMETITFTPNHTLQQSPIQAKAILGYELQAPDFDNTYYNR